MLPYWTEFEPNTRAAKVFKWSTCLNLGFDSLRISFKMPAKHHFANPHHPWERGTCENTNGLIRRFFPKKTAFGQFTQKHVEAMMWHLNHQPRKCLKWKTPCEVFGYCCQKYGVGLTANIKLHWSRRVRGEDQIILWKRKAGTREGTGSPSGTTTWPGSLSRRRVYWESFR